VDCHDCGCCVQTKIKDWEEREWGGGKGLKGSLLPEEMEVRGLMLTDGELLKGMGIPRNCVPIKSTA